MNANATWLNSQDRTLAEAARGFFQQNGSLSTSLLQRRYGIGYGRAARIMDWLKENGYVARTRPSPLDSSRSSQTLFPQDHSVVEELLEKAGLRVQLVDTEIRTRIIKIGPDEAKALIAANYKNRRVRPNVVAKYAKSMKEGRWLQSHQGIAFSKSGRGIDLQHRLLAVIQSGCTVDMMVSEGLDDQVFEVIDKHASRSTSDSLQEDRADCAIAKFLLRFLPGDNSLNTDEDVRFMIRVFRKEFNLLRSVHVPTKRVITSIPIKAAAIFQMAQMPKDSQQILQRLQDFASQKTKDFTEVMHALSNAIFANRVDASNQVKRRELFAKATKIFDPKFESSTVIRTDDSYVVLLQSRLSDIVKERASEIPLN